MPTLAANLLSDANNEHAPANNIDLRMKRKQKSITLAKGGPGSGPSPGGGKVYDRAAKVARAAERTANATRKPEDHVKAAAAHREASKAATGIMRGVHDKAAAVHDYLGSK